MTRIVATATVATILLAATCLALLAPTASAFEWTWPDFDNAEGDVTDFSGCVSENTGPSPKRIMSLCDGCSTNQAAIFWRSARFNNAQMSNPLYPDETCVGWVEYRKANGNIANPNAAGDRKAAVLNEPQDDLGGEVLPTILDLRFNAPSGAATIAQEMTSGKMAFAAWVLSNGRSGDHGISGGWMNILSARGRDRDSGLGSDKRGSGYPQGFHLVVSSDQNIPISPTENYPSNKFQFWWSWSTAGRNFNNVNQSAVYWDFVSTDTYGLDNPGIEWSHIGISFDPAGEACIRVTPAGAAAEEVCKPARGNMGQIGTISGAGACAETHYMTPSATQGEISYLTIGGRNNHHCGIEPDYPWAAPWNGAIGNIAIATGADATAGYVANHYTNNPNPPYSF